MAYEYYLNIEPLLLNAARNAVERMTDSNVCEYLSDKPEEKAFANNPENGFIAIVMSCAYIEATLNSVMRHIFVIDPDKLRSMKLDEKMDYLLKEHPEEKRTIKESKSWSDYKDLLAMRNELVHYKTNYSEVSKLRSTPAENPEGNVETIHTFTKWKKGNQLIFQYLTKPTIKTAVESTFTLVRNIIEVNSLCIFDGMPPLFPDATGLPTNYVFRESEKPDEYDTLLRNIGVLQ